MATRKTTRKSLDSKAELRKQGRKFLEEYFSNLDYEKYFWNNYYAKEPKVDTLEWFDDLLNKTSTLRDESPSLYKGITYKQTLLQHVLPASLYRMTRYLAYHREYIPSHKAEIDYISAYGALAALYGHFLTLKS